LSFGCELCLVNWWCSMMGCGRMWCDVIYSYSSLILICCW
jgi:hypothetical protein